MSRKRKIVPLQDSNPLPPELLDIIFDYEPLIKAPLLNEEKFHFKPKLHEVHGVILQLIRNEDIGGLEYLIDQNGYYRTMIRSVLQQPYSLYDYKDTTKESYDDDLKKSTSKPLKIIKVFL